MPNVSFVRYPKKSFFSYYLNHSENLSYIFILMVINDFTRESSYLSYFFLNKVKDHNQFLDLRYKSYFFVFLIKALYVF